MKKLITLLLFGVFSVCATFGSSATTILIQPFAASNDYSIDITFSGSTAYCSFTIYGAMGTTSISDCTVTLTESNGTLVKEWTNLSSSGSELNFSKSASTVTSGKTYVLSFTATIHRNGSTETFNGSITKRYN